jgi:uncharacterized paraquat-inducible protein A
MNETCSTCRYNQAKPQESPCAKCLEELHQYKEWKKAVKDSFEQSSQIAKEVE